MNTMVWKFEIEVTDEQQVKLPLFSQVLKVAPAFADAKLNLWARVSVRDEDLEDWHEKPDRFETRSLRIVGTDHRIRDWDRLQHLDTVIAGGGALVWHVFEVQ